MYTVINELRYHCKNEFHFSVKYVRFDQYLHDTSSSSILIFIFVFIKNFNYIIVTMNNKKNKIQNPIRKKL